MKIDGVNVPVIFYETILDAAIRFGLYIPHLCKDVVDRGSGGCCRLCTVEITIEGKSRLGAACETTALEDMIIRTNTDIIKRSRDTLLQLMYSEAPGNKAITDIMDKLKVKPNNNIPEKNDSRACIHCQRCVRGCTLWSHGALDHMGRGIDKKIGTPYDKETDECVGCASCEIACPLGTIECEDYGNKRRIWNNEFEMIYCSECGKLLTTKKSYHEAYYNDAPDLCHECSERYRIKNRPKDAMQNY